jgi:hypothetical protein
MNPRILHVGILLCFIGFAPLARGEAPVAPPQQEEQSSETLESAGLLDNVGHTRHMHPHGHKHPTEVAPGRFHTDRTGARLLHLPLEEDAFTFVIFGDRTGGPADGVSILADAVRDVNLLEPDLVMTVGDLINGYNDEPLWLEQMREFNAIMDQLKSPWFPVAGNHDVIWRDRSGTGEPRPEGENESLFEMHFGPLWYAFEHKNSWFIVLYSDEGPESGPKDFRNPEHHQMSPRQFNWLKETLGKAKDADHVFLFLHHPRWRGGGNYGDSWEEVHQLLVEAGNVTAVFAGHIHQMTYTTRDGIEYVSLATVGGGNSLRVPRAGFLHHFNIVTVRKNQVTMAAVPVGEFLDPREINEELRRAATRMATARPAFDGTIDMSPDASAQTTLEAALENTTPYPMDVTVTPHSRDSRWIFLPDHDHARLEPGEERTFTFNVMRVPSPVDQTVHLPELVVHKELMTETFRYPIPEQRTPMPVDLEPLRQHSAAANHALALDGDGDYVSIPSDALPLPDGPMTLEAWMRAESFSERSGLVTKMEGSDYGIFVSDGEPSFFIFLDDAYARAGTEKKLQTGRWYHIAGVYDGREVRLYVDGELAGRTRATGDRKTNNLPLIIGGDVTSRGGAMSFFHGQIDDLRLSSVARYKGDRFEPRRRLAADEQTLLLMNFDEKIAGWLFDDSPAERRFAPSGNAHLVESER